MCVCVCVLCLFLLSDQVTETRAQLELANRQMVRSFVRSAALFLTHLWVVCVCVCVCVCVRAMWNRVTFFSISIFCCKIA